MSLPLILCLLVAAIVTEGGIILGQARTIGKLQASDTQRRSTILQNETDLQVCTQSKGAIRGEYEMCLEQVAVSREDATHARDSVQRLTQTIDREAAHVRQERDRIYQRPGCEELAKLDIAAACPDLAWSLRSRAAATAGVSAAREDPGLDEGADRAAPAR